MHFAVAKGDPITVYPSVQRIYAVISSLLITAIPLTGSPRDGHLARC